MDQILEARVNASSDECKHCGERIETEVCVEVYDGAYLWFNLPCRHSYSYNAHRGMLTKVEAATALLMLES